MSEEQLEVQRLFLQQQEKLQHQKSYCRHVGGTLTRISDDSGTFQVFLSSVLESHVDGRLVVAPPSETTTESSSDTIGASASSATRLQSCHISVRPDSHLLSCKRPSIPIGSVFGLFEECMLDDEDGLREVPDPSVAVSIWERKVETNGDNHIMNEQQSQRVTPPHSEWTRQQNGPEQKPLVPDPQYPTLKWIRFPKTVATAPPVAQTSADCLFFLRSILGVSHGASPWCNLSESSSNGSHHQQQPVLPSCVALELYGSPDDYQDLIQFRTTDACPSYFLHSVSHIMDLSAEGGKESNGAWWSWMKESNGRKAAGSRVAADEYTLFVYRLLSPREELHHEYPLTTVDREQIEDLPPGCLWETYMRQKDEYEEDDADGNREKNAENKGGGDDDDDDDDWFEEFVRPVAPPYISYREYGGLLETLLEPKNFNLIRQEALSIPQWTAWPEKQHYSAAKDGSSEPTWTVFPLCHCFPASEVEHRRFLHMTCAYVPQTTRLLKEVLGDTLRTALFSRMKPDSTLEAHTGWEDLANHVYRVHLPLVVPTLDDGAAGLCGTWVDGCVETHEEGRYICFDDSKVHRAFNYHPTKERIVLIIDMARPESLPVGTATGGHTDELDDFIQSIS